MKEILKNILEKSGMTQKEFAEKLFVTPQAVSKWISGESRPSQDNVVAIFELTGFDLTKETVKMKKRSCVKMVNVVDIAEINTYEKAKSKANEILAETGIENKYSHAVYVLCSRLLPAVIGLTYHQMFKPKYETDFYSIFYNLNDYFDKEPNHKCPGLYENQLEYEFYKMGMDLFEALDCCESEKYKYLNDAMEDWYSFKKIVDSIMLTSVYGELTVSISEIAESYLK